MAINLGHLFGSYERYKEDTAIFATWLQQAATMCGYILPNLGNRSMQPSSALDSTEKYAIPVKEFVAQAKAIERAGKPNLQIPRGVDRVADRALTSRVRFAKIYKILGNDDKCNIKHAHFNTVLEETLGILRSAKAKAASAPVLDEDRSSVGPTRSANMFEVLELEDVEIKLSDLQTCDESTTKEHVFKICEPEIDVTDLLNDEMIEVICFFEDLHRIQEFLQNTWKFYGDGEVNIVTAAMTTNAALRLVNSTEEALVRKLQQTQLQTGRVMRDECSYQDLLSRLRPAANILEATTAGGWMTPFGSYVYMSVWRTLLKYARKLKYTREDSEIVYPRIASARFEQYAILSKHQTAEFKSMEQEDELLTQVIMEIIVNDYLLAQNVRKDAPRLSVTDEFSTSMLNLEKGIITSHMVFSGRVMLELHHVLKERASRGYADLKDLADFCQQAVKHVHPSAPRGNGPYWLGQDTMLAHSIFDFRNYVFDWTMAEFKGKQLARIKPSDAVVRVSDVFLLMPFQIADISQELTPPEQLVEQAMATPGARCILPSTDAFFLFNSNPVLCGTIAFNLKVLSEDAGVRLANHHLSPLLVAYLYTSLQRKGLLKLQWPAMEELIKIQIGSFFFGTLPQTEVDTHKRFFLRLGKPLSEFAPDSRMKNKEVTIRDAHATPRGNKLSPRCISPSPTSALFAKFCTGEENLIKSLYIVDALMRKSRIVKKNGNSRPSTDLNVHAFLPLFQDQLQNVLPAISINYVDLTRTCNALLKAIIDSKKIKIPRFRSWVPAAKDMKKEDLDRIPENSADVTWVHLVLQILKDAMDKVKVEAEAARRGLLVATLSDLELASPIVQKFLDDNRLLQ